MLFAVGREPRVDSADVPVKKGVEAPHPGLSDPVLPQARDKVPGRLVTREPAQLLRSLTDGDTVRLRLANLAPELSIPHTQVRREA